LYRVINNKFIINQNQINPLKVILLIIIVFTPLIFLNLYADKINNLLGEYNIFIKTIHCESTDDSNYINKLREGTNIIITNNTTNTNTNSLINSSNNSNIYTSPKSISNLSDRNYNGSTSTLNKNKFPRSYLSLFPFPPT
jgi:hypothetical protein